MGFLFVLLQPFIGHPGRIAVVAVVLAIVAGLLFFARRRAAWPITIAATMWALFAPWEWYCTVQRYNIRVDLLLIAPVLLVFTVGGAISAFLPKSEGKGQFSLRALLITVTLWALVLGLIMQLLRG